MTDPVKSNRGRIVLIGILALSLLGNALTLGAVLKLRSLKNELAGPVAESPVFPLRERRVLRAAMQAHTDQVKPALEGMIAARAAVVKAGTARPFDRAAVDTAMMEFTAEINAALIVLQPIIADALQTAAEQNPAPDN